MKSTLVIILLIIFFISSACQRENSGPLNSYLTIINTDKYYNEDVIPDAYQSVYGIWGLFEVSGGLHGIGYEPDFDYLEIKKNGIYGLVRSDGVFEYGKLEPALSENQTQDAFRIQFAAEYHQDLNPYFFSYYQACLDRNDTLDIFTLNPDEYSYHFRKIK